MSLLHLQRSIPLIRTFQFSCLATGHVSTTNLRRTYSASPASGGGLMKSKGDGSTGKEVGMPIGERIKENTKTASYTGVILLGVGLTGGLFYVIFRELFSSNSPQNIYTAALERCVNEPRIQDALGAPIKGFGEENSRRRRRHVAHTFYQTEDGVKHIRMNFYIQGIRNKATVFLEKTANASGDLDKYRYLFVQLEYYPKTVIILEDNRQEYGHNANQPSTAMLTPIV